MYKTFAVLTVALGAGLMLMGVLVLIDLVVSSPPSGWAIISVGMAFVELGLLKLKIRRP